MRQSSKSYSYHKFVLSSTADTFEVTPQALEPLECRFSVGGQVAIRSQQDSVASCHLLELLRSVGRQVVTCIYSSARLGYLVSPCVFHVRYHIIRCDKR